MTVQRHVLVTGLPHFVGRLIVRALVDQDADTRVTLLVRADRERRVRQVVGDAANVDIIPARLVRADLALTPDVYQRIASEVTDIFNLAGLYHLGVDKRRAEDVNLQSTRNLLALARNAPNLRRFNHYSTAFVSGDRRGIVLETELDRGQRFRNTYERTKFSAELEVRRAMASMPATIYRPSLVVGHSRTGTIDALDGPYFLFQLLTRTPGRVPLTVPTAHDAPFNVVPADFVADAIVSLSANPRAEGKTYHLVDPAPIRTGDALQLAAEFANQGSAPARVHGWLRRRALAIDVVDRWARASKAYLHELDGWTLFNAANALRDLHGTNVRCPSFPEYVQVLTEWARTARRGDLMPDARAFNQPPPSPAE